jgi:hypothetical protein
MSMLPQPPPGAPPPPASPAARRSRWKWRALWLVGSASITVLAVMAYTAIWRQHVIANTVEAHNNLRSMSLAFFEFETAYGAYPNAATASEVAELTDSKLPLGAKSSNDIFRQLIAAEVCQSEAMFYARIPGTHKPDNVFNDGSTALVKGEVGYSCIVGLNSKSNPECPLVVTPLIPGTNKFDRKPFDGRAIVLRVKGGSGGRIEFLPIDKNGEVVDASGRHLLDPANPVWGGVAPVIAWPE